METFLIKKKNQKILPSMDHYEEQIGKCNAFNMVPKKKREKESEEEEDEEDREEEGKTGKKRRKMGKNIYIQCMLIG